MSGINEHRKNRLCARRVRVGFGKKNVRTRRNNDMISGDGAVVAQPLFPVEDQGSIPMSPLQFKIISIGIPLAVKLNKQWHSRVPVITNPYSKNRISFGAIFKNRWFASAIWTDPIARAFNHKNYLELRRMAISEDAPKNTASRMIKIMTLIIKKELPQIVKLISYQDTDVHTGTIYKASGWTSANKSTKSNWQVGRTRNNYQASGAKIRWEKQIRPEPEHNIIPKIIKSETKQFKLPMVGV